MPHAPIPPARRANAKRMRKTMTDAARTARLEQDGWTVLRFWNDEVLKDIDNVCLHILKIVGEA